MRPVSACFLAIGLCQTTIFCAPVGTAFTYQGRLIDSGNAANGLYDVEFGLFADPTNGPPVAGSVALSAIPVTNGLFAAEVDFGTAIFAGSARWLQLSVRSSGSGGLFIPLNPRQLLTPAPFAIQAGQAYALAGVSNAPIELKLNGQRALKLEPTTSTPNILGGFHGNFVSGGIIGATIAGGGGEGQSLSGYSHTNRVIANFGTVGGGLGNIAGGEGSVISGGSLNEALPGYSTIGGGLRNSIPTGYANTIGGGRYNTNEAIDATIAGGILNAIQPNAYTSTVGGGQQNQIRTNAFHSTIAGWWENTIAVGGSEATIGGGAHNSIGQNAQGGTVGGGRFNTAAAGFGTVGGGEGNVVQAPYGMIPGGSGAVARGFGQMTFGSGNFDALGDAQTSVYVLRQTTQNTNEAVLYLDAAEWQDEIGAQQMMVPAGSSWCFDALVVGRGLSGVSAGFQLKGIVKNVGGSTTFVGTPTTTTLGADPGAAGWAVNVFTNSSQLVIKVRGGTSRTRWLATVRTVELSF